MPITNQGGEDRLPTREQELSNSALKCHFDADGVNNGNASVDLSEEEPANGREFDAAVYGQLASDEFFFPNKYPVC